MLLTGKQSNQQIGLAKKQQISRKHKTFAVPGFEPGLPDSESGVLTTTLYRKLSLVQVHFFTIMKPTNTLQGICWILARQTPAHHLWR